jgi:hypothetical protein
VLITCWDWDLHSILHMSFLTIKTICGVGMITHLIPFVYSKTEAQGISCFSNVMWLCEYQTWERNSTFSLG